MPKPLNQIIEFHVIPSLKRKGNGPEIPLFTAEDLRPGQK